VNAYRVEPIEREAPVAKPRRRSRDRVLRTLAFGVALFPVLEMATSGHISAGELGISALIVGLLLA
jgi:hypothetical protein